MKLKNTENIDTGKLSRDQRMKLRQLNNESTQKQKLIPHQNQNNQKLSFLIKFIFICVKLVITSSFSCSPPTNEFSNPPYYMVSFTSKLNSDIASDEYTQVADLMVSLAKQQPGFLGLESTRDPQANWNYH